MDNRFYSPTLGRYVSRDPIGYADGINMFAYVGNNPADKRYLFGLRADWERCHREGVVIGIVAGEIANQSYKFD